MSSGSSMVNVRGSAIVARLRFIQMRYGEAALRAVVERFSPAHRRIVEAGVPARMWVPFRLFLELNVTVDQLLGRGDLAICYEMGRYAAEANVPRLYQGFYRFGNPRFTFRKALALWNWHFDSGKLLTSDEEDGITVLRIEDFDEPHRAHCMSTLGWLTKSTEMSGGKVEEATELACRTKGDPACQLVVQWR